MTVGILGGGISGLSFAYFVNDSYQIIEKSDTCGGLCKTYEKNGFLYDQGGHIIFSTNKEILQFELDLLKGKTHQKKRNSKVWYKNRFVKYPFENGLNVLDKEEIFECLYGYFNNSNPIPKNLEEWFYYTFGNAISEKYMLPYNKKIWKFDPKLMGLEWVERIPKPPVEDILKSAIGIETEGYTHQLYYHYPIKGGFQTLIREFEHKIKNIKRGQEVIAITKKSQGWEVETNKEKFAFDKLISTIPIFELVKVLKEKIPQEVNEAIKSLHYNSLIVVLIGLKKTKYRNLATVYVSDPESLAHRYCFSDGFSEYLAPEGFTSIFAEITANPIEGLFGLNDNQIVDKIIKWLQKEAFIEPNSICETDIKHIKYAYPVYDINYSKNVKVVYDYFEKIDLHLLGRFAQFIYINSDVCIANAKKLAERINSYKEKSIL